MCLKKLVLVIALTASACLTNCGTSSSRNDPSSSSTGAGPGGGLNGLDAGNTIPHPPHVGILVLENVSSTDIIGKSYAPYLNSLAKQYAYSTGYRSDSHGSLSNYFKLTAGQPITDNQYVTVLTKDNIFRHMLNAHKSFKSYEDSIPYSGDVYDIVKWPYLKRHNPMAYFSDIVNSSTNQWKDRGFWRFSPDIINNLLPQYFFITPNALHDMHSCPNGGTCTMAEKVAYGDKWLATVLPQYLNSAQFNSGDVLIITADEPNFNSSGSTPVPFIIIGNAVRGGYHSGNYYNHYSTLKTMLLMLGMSTNLGNASTANNLSEFFY